MNNLEKQIAIVTRAINVASDKFPNDDKKQYKAFMYLLTEKANLNVECSEKRFLQFRRLYIRTISPWREITDHVTYENAVIELFGFYNPISIL